MTKSRSVHGVGCENRSKSGRLERIGIALAGIVSHCQTVNKGFSDIRNFGFAEFASGGFPNILQRVARAPQSRRTPFELYAAKGIMKSSPRKEAVAKCGEATAQSETDTGGAGIGAYGPPIVWPRTGESGSTPRRACVRMTRE